MGILNSRCSICCVSDGCNCKTSETLFGSSLSRLSLCPLGHEPNDFISSALLSEMVEVLYPIMRVVIFSVI